MRYKEPKNDNWHSICLTSAETNFFFSPYSRTSPPESLILQRVEYRFIKAWALDWLNENIGDYYDQEWSWLNHTEDGVYIVINEYQMLFSTAESAMFFKLHWEGCTRD